MTECIQCNEIKYNKIMRNFYLLRMYKKALYFHNTSISLDRSKANLNNCMYYRPKK